MLAEGKTVLFEGQMRIAFVREALTAFEIKNARILCVECDDSTRARRLIHDRLQPELANEIGAAQLTQSERPFAPQAFSALA
ncbi:MAG TPA: hypothetical protein VKB47_15060 [Terracidiphilus sp.]|nr:hypothetical protein [Terracidiphilus sp.]